MARFQIMHISVDGAGIQPAIYPTLDSAKLEADRQQAYCDQSGNALSNDDRLTKSGRSLYERERSAEYDLAVLNRMTM